MGLESFFILMQAKGYNQNDKKPPNTIVQSTPKPGRTGQERTKKTNEPPPGQRQTLQRIPAHGLRMIRDG